MAISNNLAAQDIDQLRNMFVYGKDAVAGQNIEYFFYFQCS